MAAGGDSSSKTIDALQRDIGEACFQFRFARSGGPGGQNVNKVNTRVTLLFDLKGSSALTEAQKRRVRTALRTRMTKDGLLRVVSVRHRTQQANRRAAMARFYELLADALYRPPARKPTKPTRASIRRRLEDKAHQAERKRMRKEPPRDN